MDGELECAGTSQWHIFLGKKSLCVAQHSHIYHDVEICKALEKGRKKIFYKRKFFEMPLIPKPCMNYKEFRCLVCLG